MSRLINYFVQQRVYDIETSYDTQTLYAITTLIETMNSPESPSPNETEKIKEYSSFDDIPNDPRSEGLRPDHGYAGGDPDEIIVVSGIKYRKIVAMRAYNQRGDGVITLNRPYTEKEYFSHSTVDVGPGPGWDQLMTYLRDLGIFDFDPDHLSDLPFYRLQPVEQKG